MKRLFCYILLFLFTAASVFSQEFPAVPDLRDYVENPAASGVGCTARGIFDAYKVYPAGYERIITIRPL